MTAGAAVQSGMYPVAALYAGHQFGHYVSQLGDGRALLLGDTESTQGYVEWQLKGAGKQAYTQPAPDWAKGLSLSCSS